MSFNFLRWLRRCIPSKGLGAVSTNTDISEDPEVIHRQAVLDAALRDAGAIHGADPNWIVAELVRLKMQGPAEWEVRLVVNDSEMEVWDRAEAFQITFLEQLRELAGLWGETLPAVTWKFNSHQLARQRTEAVVRPLRRKDESKTRSAVTNDTRVAGALRDNASDPPMGLKGELLV